jgi:deazaflavin-dependent oxidoreductase (nitroreductase family)
MARDASVDDKWPAKRFHVGRVQRVANTVIGTLASWGLVPHTYTLSVRGRKTGRLHSTPVTVVETGDEKWLVAPYGPVHWVLNARAAGRVTLSRRRTSTEYDVRELPPAEAAPVLRQYLQVASATRSYFTASKDAPVEDFLKEAGRHPVFALVPTTRP